MKLTLTQYAKHRGVTPPTAMTYLKLIEEAAFKNDRGRWEIDVELADKLLDERLNKRKGPNAKKYTGGKPKDKKIKLPPEDELEKVAGESGVGDVTFSEAQRLKIMYEAGIKKLQLAQMDGDLVLLETVKKTLFTAARQIRDEIINISARTCTVLAAESDPIKVEEILKGEHINIFNKLKVEWESYE